MLVSLEMPHSGFDLRASAHQEMINRGFDPDWNPAIDQQVKTLEARPRATPDANVRDLRSLLWSSIDNDTSRDLDQIEVAERTDSGIRIRIGVADVDGSVAMGSPIDQHAQSQTTTVYTAVRTFSMLPEALSTDLTSLAEKQDRVAVVIEMVVDAAGAIASPSVYRALVSNKAQLTYNGVGPWLEGSGAAPQKVAASVDLQAQLRLQDEAARALRAQRNQLGALDFDRLEAEPVIVDGEIKGIESRKDNRASHLIEDFMIAANEVMAQTLTRSGVAAIRRVVKSPERWPRIMDLAEQHGTKLPAQPDSGALAAFLRQQQQTDPVHYPDLSLAVIKLLGPGEYVLVRPGDPPLGHFGLAAHDYTHSTAPNRRFADLATQRLIKAALAQQKTPYSEDALAGIAQHCTEREDAARKVERVMNKRVAAVAFQNRRGQMFDAVVTGVTPRGVFVRVTNPLIEGRLMHGESGVDVGDRIRVTLLGTDPQHGFIDFGR